MYMYLYPEIQKPNVFLIHGWAMGLAICSVTAKDYPNKV